MAEITVVVAARNVEAFIGATIESIRGQDMEDWQLLIVVDSSTDGTARIAGDYTQRDPRIKTIEGDFNGVSAARNRGLAATTTSLVIFVDGDDLLRPTGLAHFVAALRERPSAVAAVAGHAKVDEGGRLIPGEEGAGRSDFAGALPAILKRNVIVNGGTIAIRADAARQVGGFDHSLRVGEDWEFWVRLALTGPFILIEGEPILLYRQRRQSAMGHKGSSFAEATLAVDRIFANAALRDRYTSGRLARWKREALIDVHWTACRAALHRRDSARFLALGALTALRFPDSLLKAYLWRYLGRQLGALRFVKS